MRIGIVSTMRGFPWGGSEELWLATARAAIDQGHQVVAFVGAQSADSPKLRDAVKAGIRIESIGRRSQWELIRDATGYRIKSLIRRAPFFWRFAQDNTAVDSRWSKFVHFSPDVVLFNSAGNNDLGKMEDMRFPGEWVQRSKTPYVIVCERAFDSEVPWPGMVQRMREMVKFAYRVGFLAQFDLRLMERHLTTKIPNDVRIVNPVNLSSTALVPWPVSNGKAHLGCLARLDVEDKGFDLLLEALSFPQWLDRAWTLEIGGVGPHEQYIRELISFYRLDDRVKLIGYVGDVRDFWSRHHLLLVPSRRESVPLAMVEAMLCGRPALVTDCGGPAEWIVDGRNGFVSPAASVRSIHESLERAWHRRDEWPSIGCQARESVLARIDLHPGRTLLDLLFKAATEK